MSQEKTAEIINFAATCEAAPATIGDETAGAFLAQARKSAGISLEDVSEAIKVKTVHLQSIEETRADLLPAAPYAIGFVKVYAQFLGLDAEGVVNRFKEDIRAAAPQPIDVDRQESASSDLSSVGEGARMASIFGILAVVIFAVWIGFQIVDGGASQDRTPAREPAPHVRLTNIPSPKPTLLSPTSPTVETKFTPAGAAKTAKKTLETPSPDKVADETESHEAESVAAPVKVPQADDSVPAAADDSGASTEVASPEEPVADSLAAESQAEPDTQAPMLTAAQLRDPVIEPAKPVRTSAPEYPSQCASGAAALESVTVMFDVSAAGRPDNVRIVSSTNPCFEEEAVWTISRWRFNPRTVDGAPRADLSKKATVNFRR